MSPRFPTLHPADGDPVESARCPACGTPGVLVETVGRWQMLTCPTCGSGPPDPPAAA
jgi:hypothetical protein